MEAQTSKLDTSYISDDIMICSCFKVYASAIQMAIHSGGAKQVSDVSDLTNAGIGCRACVCKIERILKGFPAQCGDCRLCPGCGTISRICKCA